MNNPEFCRWVLAESPQFQSILNQAIHEHLRDQIDTLAIAPCGPIEVDVSHEQRERLFALVGAQWEKVGKAKPYWSVLSSDDYLPESISETRLQEFYASGIAEVNLLETLCERNGLTLPTKAHCLEFGCGVGRVTVHLARRFSTVEGLDISAPNLAECLKVLRNQNSSNVTTRHLRSPAELAAVAPFDVFFTRIVLQHNPPPIQKLILDALLGKLRPGGVGVFQTIVHGKGYRYAVAEHLANAQVEVYEMHALPMREIFRCIEASSCMAMEVIRDTAGGFGVGSYTFLVYKPFEAS